MNLIKSTTMMVCGLVCSSAAYAHTSYLNPTLFNTSKGTFVTLESSFSDAFPVPEIAVKSDDYHVIKPNGERDDYDSITTFRQLVILENELDEEGTYRFTTGVRYGRISKSALVDGEWKPVFGPDAKVPENATEVKTSQTVTVADVYVTKGAPTWDSVNKTLGKLVLKTGTHPNEIYLGEGLEVTVLFEGKPLADQEFELVREGGEYEEPKFVRTPKSDAEGKLNLTFDKPGLYLLMTRHRADAPEGAETDIHSHTTSLTFQVLR